MVTNTHTCSWMCSQWYWSKVNGANEINLLNWVKISGTWIVSVIVVLEKILESPLDCKEIQPVHPKGDQSWIFIGRTDAEAENPILWPPDAKNWLIWKDPDAGKDWRQEEKRMTEDEMVGWHHQLNGHEFWVNSGSWWWTGRPGVLQSMGSQRVGQDWATELNWADAWYITLNGSLKHYIICDSI